MNLNISSLRLGAFRHLAAATVRRIFISSLLSPSLSLSVLSPRFFTYISLSRARNDSTDDRVRTFSPVVDVTGPSCRVSRDARRIDPLLPRGIARPGENQLRHGAPIN